MTDRPESRAERRRRDLLARVLESANSLFAKRGFAETSMAAIAADADVSVGTLYNLFDSKDELYQKLLNGKSGLFRDRLIAALRDAETEADALDRYVGEAFSLFREQAEFIRLYYQVNNHARLSLRASLVEESRELYEDTLAALARKIDGLDGTHARTPSAHAYRLAVCCQSMANELFLLHLDDPQAHPEHEIVAEARRMIRALTNSDTGETNR